MTEVQAAQSAEQAVREASIEDVGPAIELVGLFLNSINIPASLAGEVVATNRVLSLLADTVKQAIAQKADA